MCGIIGIFNDSKVKDKLKLGIELMRHRGLDSQNIAVFSNSGLGHTLHAMVNFVPQPLEGRFVFNGEIYNWQELNKKYGLKTKNDSETVLLLLDKKGIDVVEEFDGVFAFCYWDHKKSEKVYLVRDSLGVKPIWFSNKDSFSFASEKKVLERLAYMDIEELNPRNILVYDIKNKRINFIERRFFKTKPEHENLNEIKENVKKLLEKSIQKRISNKKTAVLFSGGIDSTVIAFLLKKPGIDFTCYTAVLDEPGTKKAEDLIWAEKVSKEFRFNLKVKKIGLKEVQDYLKTIVPLIEDTNVVKVGVALPIYLACEMAKKDGCKVVFSGLGSEEIFAGYERHEKSSDVNEECLSGLRKIYERDLYRDDVISRYNNLEMRLPFLDRELVDYSLKIPAKYKLKRDVKKYVLRIVAEELGIPKDIAFRKKRAAQYGSNFDKALDKLARKEKKKKSEYLRKFYPSHNLRLGVLFSSGKDSNLALHIMKRQNYEISCLITIKSNNPDSFMFHTPAIELAKYQAYSMGLPLVEVETKGEKEKELKDLKKAIIIAKEEHKIDGVVTGALFSTYQRDRIEKVCDEAGLKVFSPLWQKNQEEEMRELLRNDFKIIFTAVAAEGLDKSWLGKIIDEKDINRLVELNKKSKINIAGEGGEFESFVLDGPLYKKEIKIIDSDKVMENEFTGKLNIKKISFLEKNVL